MHNRSSYRSLAPPGCARYTAVLGKPLGLVLEERKSGGIFVAEVQVGGNAERDGQISAGDELLATSGITHTREMQYQDNIVKTGETVVRLTCRGENFNTVMAAIGSHQAHQKVTLEFQRCDPNQKQ
ncbi:hypothetical protein WJX72_000187 [[Myrmecia] bisecta]|uniref:PDZ domain-containing protein n=1 Tax=[Myrmecia] bisecta TaxID=41462 RepID=A0AAW1PCB2_9CHLO